MPEDDEGDKYSLTVEFTITVGNTLDAFSFVLSNGEKHFRLTKTEIRLYTVDADEKGKLVFKNYKGRHKNLTGCLREN